MREVRGMKNPISNMWQTRSRKGGYPRRRSTLMTKALTPGRQGGTTNPEVQRGLASSRPAIVHSNAAAKLIATLLSAYRD